MIEIATRLSIASPSSLSWRRDSARKGTLDVERAFDAHMTIRFGLSVV